MKIKDIVLRQIYDSRGEETLEVDLVTGAGDSFWAQIPSGKSRGKNEASVLNFKQAQRVYKELLEKDLIGKEFDSIKKLDKFLISWDDTKNKGKLGGNLTLGISVAFARALAFEKGMELWKLLGIEFFGGEDFDKAPMIFSNLINGGAHAENNLDIQEYMVVAGNSGKVKDSVKRLVQFYKKLEDYLKENHSVTGSRGKLAIGDEGGFSVNFKNNFEPVEILENLIRKLEVEKWFVLGLDVAASNFYKKGKYLFDGKEISADELKDIYLNYFKRSKFLYSIEDPFAEEDFGGFKKLAGEIGENKIIVGDDLTVTNPVLINKFAKEGLINCVIIKPNQIGTVMETCEAMLAAKKNKIGIIVSHRSGETNDNFIIHLARAGGADGVKIGAPVRERMGKFNELMRIYE
ncbi:MAG: phosphopyruvate hydratase [Candidatus Pacebacteria bacterium]|nr:phosphopyruvate hydratase [Candidatus Paceibacterota bacterium]